MKAASSATTSAPKMPQGAQVGAGAARIASLGCAAVLIESRARQLRQGQNGEAWVPGKISPPQPPGFGTKPENPFEAAVLHPAGRLRLGAGDKVECGAHT